MFDRRMISVPPADGSPTERMHGQLQKLRNGAFLLPLKSHQGQLPVQAYDDNEIRILTDSAFYARKTAGDGQT